MPGVISNSAILPDTNLGPSQNLKTNLFLNGNILQKIEENRRLRYTKFPSLRGRYSFYSDDANVNIRNNFTKQNDEGQLQPLAPHRIYDSVIDPTSGFVSAGCDVGGKAGNPLVESMVQLNRSPQSIIQEVQNTKQNTVAPELKRPGTWCPGTPTPWNSRKTLDVWIRAKLGGWTSDVDPRKAKDFNKRPQTSVMNEQTDSNQHKLALKYMYGTSTQRGYEDVPWDILLRPKQWPPKLAVEEKPDIVLYHRNRNTKHHNPAAQKAQAGGYDSELFLPRYPHNKDGPVTSTISANQIQLSPLYSGPTRAENVDVSMEKFEPYSRKVSSATHSDKTVQLDKPQTSSSSSPDHGRKSGTKKVTFGPSESS